VIEEKNWRYFLFHFITNKKLNREFRININKKHQKIKKKKRENQKIIMMVGMLGSGKTTTCAKLALYFKKRGIISGVISADTERPGAYNQLDQLYSPVFGIYTEYQPIKIIKPGLKYFSRNRLVFIDNSGTSREPTTEVPDVIKSDQSIDYFIFLIIDITQSKYFIINYINQCIVRYGSTRIKIIITKMDAIPDIMKSDKFSHIISFVTKWNIQILFICDGEYMKNIKMFDMEKFILKSLGLNNLFFQFTSDDKKKCKGLYKRFLKNITVLNDFKLQLELCERFLPALGMVGGNNMYRRYKIILSSISNSELNMRNYKLVYVQKSRAKRIMLGSGCDYQELQNMVINFEATYQQMKKMYKELNMGKWKSDGMGGKMGGKMGNIQELFKKFSSK
jgi:signal recognition particle subunit SRP54